MTDARALPDFKVAEDVDDDAEHGTEGVEEDEMGKSCQGKRAFGT